MLLAPGMFIAAIVFTEGIHSNHPIAYPVLAAITNALVSAMALRWAGTCDSPPTSWPLAIRNTMLAVKRGSYYRSVWY